MIKKGLGNIKLGFTIVELLVVIVVVGVLATVTSVYYVGVQSRAQNARRADDIDSVMKKIELYHLDHGSYPATTANQTSNWKSIDVRTDDNCFNGSSQTDWVPDITPLPQSVPNTGVNAGVDGSSGCYLYASNGVQYVLSAWNMLSDAQTAKPFYRRLGFRTFQTPTSTQFYTCNENVTGGANGDYDIAGDYYKHSYTLSNITGCDETPPPGA